MILKESFHQLYKNLLPSQLFVPLNERAGIEIEDNIPTSAPISSSSPSLSRSPTEVSTTRLPTDYRPLPLQQLHYRPSRRQSFHQNLLISLIV